MGRKQKGKLMGGVKPGFNCTLTTAIQGGEARVTRGGGAALLRCRGGAGGRRQA
jgi:hypothetical protein